MNSKFHRRGFLKSTAKTGGALFAATQWLGSHVKAETPNDASATSPSIDRTKLNKLMIFDRESVADADGVTFHLNQAKKHPQNPVLIPSEPHQWDSLQVVWPGTVLYDADDKLFRCWYSGMDAVQAARPSTLWCAGYAESTDGLRWSKPELGQYTHNGFATNRLKLDWPQVTAGAHHLLSLVVKNPDQSDAQRKFLSLWQIGAGPGMHKVLASSPDGKVWKEEGIAFKTIDDARPNFVDTSSVVFQPHAANENERVLVYGQIYGRAPAGRQIGVATGKSLDSFQIAGTTDDECLALRADKTIEDENHFASVKKFGDTFVMLFESDRFSRRPLHGDLRLAISTDGKKFRRVHSDTPLVATGSRGMWDENLLVVTTSAMQEVGDEIWIYYFGCPNVFTQWPADYAVDGKRRGSMFYPAYLGLATLPRDRFAYAEGPGSLTTPQLTIGDQGLWLNADGDGIGIAAIDGAGAVVAEGQLPATQPNVLERSVQWSGSPPAQPCQIRVTLRDGHRLYALGY